MLLPRLPCQGSPCHICLYTLPPRWLWRSQECFTETVFILGTASAFILFYFFFKAKIILTAGCNHVVVLPLLAGWLQSCLTESCSAGAQTPEVLSDELLSSCAKQQVLPVGSPSSHLGSVKVLEAIMAIFCFGFALPLEPNSLSLRCHMLTNISCIEPLCF